jgi:hypothetical protein
LRRLANKTVTVSFWAMANSGTPKLGISLDQAFGSGGSPSANVLGTGVAVTLSTTWTRYSQTFTLPSIAGKTLGTNGNDATWLNFWSSSSTTFASRAGNIGVQTAIIQLWGVQLELGGTATPLEKLDPQQDLAKAQRFYCTQAYSYQGLASTTAWAWTVVQTLPVQMRALPTITNNNTSATNIAGASVGAQTVGQVYVTGTINSGWAYTGTFTASADL